MMNDFDFLLCVGEIFTIIAYGQLIIESAAMEGIDDDLLDQIFDFMVRDFAQYGLELMGKPSSNKKQQAAAQKMLKRPNADAERFEKVLSKYVYSLVDVYTMNP
jgi:acyl-CoA dehydrogenase